ncbi:hypothetical protein BC828DRAFT_17905 [Blastocladiella britannica]|nr:hypothetical protein BC828DRAFT_17905 [Blastocladiella britannica]
MRERDGSPRPHSRHGHVRLARERKVSHVHVGALHRQPLGLVGRERPPEDQRELANRRQPFPVAVAQVPGDRLHRVRHLGAVNVHDRDLDGAGANKHRYLAHVAVGQVGAAAGHVARDHDARTHAKLELVGDRRVLGARDLLTFHLLLVRERGAWESGHLVVVELVLFRIGPKYRRPRVIVLAFDRAQPPAFTKPQPIQQLAVVQVNVSERVAEHKRAHLPQWGLERERNRFPFSVHAKSARVPRKLAGGNGRELHKVAEKHHLQSTKGMSSLRTSSSAASRRGIRATWSTDVTCGLMPSVECTVRPLTSTAPTPVGAVMATRSPRSRAASTNDRSTCDFPTPPFPVTNTLPVVASNVETTNRWASKAPSTCVCAATALSGALTRFGSVCHRFSRCRYSGHEVMAGVRLGATCRSPSTFLEGVGGGGRMYTLPSLHTAVHLA